MSLSVCTLPQAKPWVFTARIIEGDTGSAEQWLRVELSIAGKRLSVRCLEGSCIATAPATEEARNVAAGRTASPPAETVDLKAAWNEADLARRLWEAQLKRAQDEERGRLDKRERQLDARRKELEEQKKEQERLARNEATKQKAEADALGAERRKLLARRKELQDQELQLTGREENARAGFVAQQDSALAELRQRKTGLEAELQALPAKLLEVHVGWVKDAETLRQRLEGEARQAREQLATELAGRRRQAEQELEQEHQRGRRSLEDWRKELESREATQEQQRQTLRQERIQLRADEELLGGWEAAAGEAGGAEGRRAGGVAASGAGVHHALTRGHSPGSQPPAGGAA